MQQKLEYTRECEFHLYSYKGKVLEDIQFITFDDTNILFRVNKTLDHRYVAYEATFDYIEGGKVFKNGHKVYNEKALAISPDFYIQIKDKEIEIITNLYLSDLVEKGFTIIPVRYKEKKP